MVFNFLTAIIYIIKRAWGGSKGLFFLDKEIIFITLF